MKQYEAIFFDMDGTLIETKTGFQFPKGLWDWKPKKGVQNKILEFCATCNPKCLLIVSNQSQLSKRKNVDEAEKEFREEKLKKVASKLFPPHIKSDVTCAPRKDHMRKPNTGMGELFASLYDLNLENCLMVGDASDAEKNFSDSDRKFAENCGMDYLDIKEFLNTTF